MGLNITQIANIFFYFNFQFYHIPGFSWDIFTLSLWRLKSLNASLSPPATTASAPPPPSTSTPLGPRFKLCFFSFSFGSKVGSLSLEFPVRPMAIALLSSHGSSIRCFLPLPVFNHVRYVIALSTMFMVGYLLSELCCALGFSIFPSE